ncbi:MAG: hypothetical protein QM689_12740 [Oscillospiraceae bacterium]
MNVINITVGEKTYTATRITARQTRESFAINTAIIKNAQIGENLKAQRENEATENPNSTAYMELLEELNEINSRKAALICDVFGGRFSVDELEGSLTLAEIDGVVRNITRGISGAITKN